MSAHLRRSWAALGHRSGSPHFLVLPKDPAEAHKALVEHHRSHSGGRQGAGGADWNRALMHEITANQGFSVHDKVGDAPSSGYMVSDVGAEETYDLAAVAADPSIIEAYYRRHEAELRDPQTFFGAWVHEGKVFFDVSRHYTNEADAIQAAQRNHQLAYFDLSTFESIYTPPVT